MAAVDADSRGLLEELRTCRLPHFDHEGHVRVAWALLHEHGLVETLRRLPDLLRNYARSKGREDLYHETVTFAFTTLVNERVNTQPDADWPTFAAAFPELFDAQLLNDYYSPEQLKSPRARSMFVLARRPG